MKKDIDKIQMDQFRYDLPENRIARYPLEIRDKSKLLVYRDGVIEDKHFCDLSEEIPGESVIVRNNTRVIQARLEFYKETGGKIQVFCLEPADPPDYEQNLSQSAHASWYCLIGNAKKWKSGTLTSKLHAGGKDIEVSATRMGREGQKEKIRFSWLPADLSLSEILDFFGQTPIPPYLDRESQEADKTRYQTIYALHNGSVAAPTAGLHFTSETEKDLLLRNITTAELTLHVGAGTFTPVKSKQITDHKMHTEHIEVSRDCIHDILNNDKNGVTVVGTTSLRTLESLYWLGYLIHQGMREIDFPFHIDQWLPYAHQPKLTRRQALLEIVAWMTNHSVEKIEMTTSLIIVPGYQIKMADRLITNFHQPGSTLLLLVAASTGSDWHKIYQHALDHDYRFLSYGDSSLLHLSRSQP